ncbi:MAG TPA: hypothetical protein GX716_10490 [Firmicutes bacterium]|nr:hypothetical protein [Candidatus Fermentithermobacillaceae bacterium]
MPRGPEVAAEPDVVMGLEVIAEPAVSMGPEVAAESHVAMDQEVATETGVTEGAGETSGQKVSLEAGFERLTLLARGSTCPLLTW